MTQQKTLEEIRKAKAQEILNILLQLDDLRFLIVEAEKAGETVRRILWNKTVELDINKLKERITEFNSKLQTIADYQPEQVTQWS